MDCLLDFSSVAIALVRGKAIMKSSLWCFAKAKLYRLLTCNVVCDVQFVLLCRLGPKN